MTKICNSAPLMPVVAAALVDADGRVLLQQRPPGKSLAGLWEFPGGKVESGETPEAALIAADTAKRTQQALYDRRQGHHGCHSSAGEINE